MQRNRPRYIAGIDSSTSMLVAVARFLEGKDFPALGAPTALGYVPPLFNWLPARLRARVYSVSALAAARPGHTLGEVRAERISRWVVGLYQQRRRSPAIVVGSANGALVHLCAALGVPWLPQTFLIPVRQEGGHQDDVLSRVEGALAPARRLLDANPELQVNQLHDPANDRPQLRHIDYFRVKRLTLGETYARFIESALEPGGTIFLAECERAWPTTLVGERHVFQMGGVGGVTMEEYFEGGQRVARFLERHGSPRRRWNPPAPDGERPEAEWGFEPSLREDVERLARRRGYRVVRIAFREPEDPSPLLAELYRWWYRARELPTNRLLVECFFLLEPWWALRTGSVPFWMVMNSAPSPRRVEEYLDGAEPYDHIHMMLLSNAVDAIGNASIEQCRGVLARARKGGDFVGVNERKYPTDLATLSRYHSAMRRIPSRHAIPGPLSLGQLDAFLKGAGDRFRVRWAEHVPAPVPPRTALPAGP